MNKKLETIFDVVLGGIVDAILIGIGLAVGIAIGKEDKTNE